LEILLLHAVKDGLLKRVELSPVAIQRGEPTDHKYEVTDAGLSFVSRYIQGEDISRGPATAHLQAGPERPIASQMSPG
jgi:hypothetical protein